MKGVPAASSAPLLDQVSAQQLTKYAAARATTVGVPSVDPLARRRAGHRARALLLRVIAPLAFFALAIVSIAGVAGTAATSFGDADGLTLDDAAVLALLVFSVASVFRQGLGLLRRAPLRLTIRIERSAAGPGAGAGPRPPPAVSAATQPGRWIPPLLDQASADDLSASESFRVPRRSVVGAATRTTRRTSDTALWVVLGVLSITLLTVVTARLGLRIATDLVSRGIDVGLVLRACLFSLALLGLVLVVRAVVAAYLDRLRRRRRSAAMRLLRQLLSLAAGGRGRSRDPVLDAIRALGAMAVVAIVAMLSVGFSGGTASAAPGATPAVIAPVIAPVAPGPTSTTARPPAASTFVVGGTPTPGPSAVAGASAVVTSPPASPTSSPTSTPTVRPTPSRTPRRTRPPTPRPPTPRPPTPRPPTPPPTLVPTPKPTPSASAPPTPAIPDIDQDGVLTTVELRFGSDPKDPASTPEDAIYDAETGGFTCIDAKDNDRDGFIDAGDPGCA